MSEIDTDNTTATQQPEDERPHAGVAVAAYINRISSRMFWRLWWLPLLPLAVIIGGLAYDWRWAVVGLILLFIIFPFVVTMAVMNHALRPETVALTRVATAELDSDTLRLLDADGSEIRVIPASEIRSVTVGKGRLEVVIGPRPSDIVILDASQVASDVQSALLALPMEG